MKLNKRLFLVVLLVISLTLAQVAAAFAEEESFDKFYEDFEQDELVTIIVELESEPLIEYYKGDKDTIDFLKSTSTRRMEGKIEEEQEAIIEDVMNITGVGEIQHKYSVIFNGFSVEAEYGDLEKIKKLNGVKNAFVAITYEIIEPVDDDIQPTVYNSSKIIGAYEANRSGYRGANSVIAVLDTGLNVNHIGFSGTMENIKYSKNDISDLISQSNNLRNLSVDDIYKSSKIPFAYDYAGNDCDVTEEIRHGTHVTGIIGANAGETTGISPDVQLLIMKVFGSQTAVQSDILAALEDAVILGADAINLSFGTPAGFHREDENNIINHAYERLSNTGIMIYASAGNESSASYGTKERYPLSTNPDYSIIGAPSTYSAPISVASVHNVEPRPYFIAGEELYYYSDVSNEKNLMDLSRDEEYEFIDVKLGMPEDIEEIELEGKIALLESSTKGEDDYISLIEKEESLFNKGAVGILVYENRQSHQTELSSGELIPVASISSFEVDVMIELEEKLIKIHINQVDDYKTSLTGMMSPFSSWGITSDFKLKPEVSAPGGNIYSTTSFDGGYGASSGTSMSCPHLTSSSILIKEYYDKNSDLLNGLVESESKEIINNIIMSTAEPILENDDTPFSPRKQGAGLVNIQKAINAKAYLTGDYGGLPKAELGDNTYGDFNIRFYVRNISDEDITYEISTDVLTDRLFKMGKKNLIGQTAVSLNEDSIVYSDEFITVPSGTDKEVSVMISLSDAAMTKLQSDFPNGIYIDGYIYLTNVDRRDDVVLSLPYVGFYGSWADIPVFDSTFYDDNAVSAYRSAVVLYGKKNYRLGINGYDNSLRDKEKIAFSPVANEGAYISGLLGLLRNVENLNFTLTDRRGRVVYNSDNVKQKKSFFNARTRNMSAAKDREKMYMKDSRGRYLPDGRYNYTITAAVDDITFGGYKEQSISFPITIDSVKPRILNSRITCKNENMTWRVRAKDNHYIEYICPLNSSGERIGSPIPINADKRNSTVSYDFDLNSKEFEGITHAKLEIGDYAGNVYTSKLFNLHKKHKKCKKSGPVYHEYTITEENF